MGANIKSNKTVVPHDSVLLSKLNPEIPRVWVPGESAGPSQVSSTEFLAFTPPDSANRSLLFSLFYDRSFRTLLTSMVMGTSKSHQRVPSRALRDGCAAIRADPAAQRLHVFVAVVFVLSGFAAVVYQVAWQRTLVTTFGVNMESVTVVVTAFMLGLGFGSLLGGRLADLKRIDHLLAFAAIEGVICIYGVGSIALFRVVGELAGVGSLAVVFLATFATVLLPTLFMGATLPLLVGHAVRRSSNVGRSMAVLYAANTFGSAIAAVVTAIVLFRHLGLQGSVLVASALNATVALLGMAIRNVESAGGHLPE